MIIIFSESNAQLNFNVSNKMIKRNTVLACVLCVCLLSDFVNPRVNKKFHCFPSICKFMHCEVERVCEYPKSYMKKKGGLCGCCDECRVVRMQGETCNAIFNIMYPPKLVCGPGLECDDYTFRCVNRSAPATQWGMV